MARVFVTRTFAVMGGLIAILMTLDLLGKSGAILAFPGNGEAEIWYYISLRLPLLIEFLLPFSALLGALIALATMNANSEIVSMKAAGASAHQILAPLILTGFVISIGLFFFNDRVSAPAYSTLNAWEEAEFGAIPDDRRNVTNVWVRHGDDLINARTVSGRRQNTVLREVTLYDRQGGRLERIVRAERAVRDGDGWRLEAASQFDVEAVEVTPLENAVIAEDVTPDQFTLANVDARGLSFSELREAITDLQAAGRPTVSLEAGLWHKISGPLSTLLMPLLGAVAGFGLARSGQLFIRAIIGMALGFTYFVADNFALAMGNIGTYPPLMAAWAPFFLFLLIGEAVLVRTEE
ncbi:MAG: LPS export ABC transporter permease LptG [Sphingomonadaceae bacterium]|nr:LPS export ABC transporter permease LptG [Sphingomonadaceae bacterium]